MPPVRPFRGLTYALDRFGPDLTDLVCPPYDVIGPAEQVQLLERSPYNAVRLELALGGDPHASAAQALRRWRAEGVLGEAVEPLLYRYAHALPSAPDEPAVRGLVARVLLAPWGEGMLRHEHTMPGPKADRLGLLRATGTQLSPTLALYVDRSDAYEAAVTGGRPVGEWQARDGDGLRHWVAALAPDDEQLAYLAGQSMVMADGHHRYETALGFQAEVRADPRFADATPGSLGCDWIMVVLVNAAREPMEIRPTHRLLRRADPDAVRGLVRDPGPLFTAIAVAPAALAGALEQRRAAEEPVFGLVLPGNEGWLLVGDADGVADRMRREQLSPAVRGLDLAVLHAALLGDRLGIDAAAVAAGEALAYTRDPDDALSRVASGEATAAILVRPTRLDQLIAVVEAGDVMPQKSTYFYPKLLTGMVFNPLEDA